MSDDNWGCMFFIFLAVVATGLFGAGVWIGTGNMREAAIKAGVAEYRLVSPESDKTEFKWKEMK